MPQWIIELLNKNYDAQHGVVNIRPVVDTVLQRSTNPFLEISNTFVEATRQWQLPLIEALRTLAASGQCTTDDARFMLEATRTVAEDVGSDEYFKTVNALVSSQASAAALVTFISSLLAGSNEFKRRLAFYAVGLLAERSPATVPERLLTQLKSEADLEQSPARRAQFLEVLARLQPSVA